MQDERKKYLTISLIVGVAFLIIDIITKNIANNYLSYNSPANTFIPFVDLYLTHNTGYHYIFGEINNHTLWSLAGLIAALILIGTFIRSIIKENIPKFELVMYSIILSLTIGALGNVFEILFTGKATDFFIFHPFPWPSNIADQFINGIIFIVIPTILLKNLFNWLKNKKSPKTQN